MIDMKAVVREVLSDGKSRTKEEVYKDVETHLGRPVAKIAVYGTLRAKEFSQTDGQVSLVQ